MKLLATIARELFGWVVLLLFWLREIAGWVMLVLGLLVFYQCFALLVSTNHIIQVIPLTFLGFVVFRAGLHMLKVSAAALVCLRTQDQIDAEREPSARRGAPTTRLQLRTAPFELGPRNPTV